MASNTIKSILAAATNKLCPLVDSPLLEAEILLCHALDCDRSRLHAWPDKIIDAVNETKFNSLIKRRVDGEPIAYITGKRDFWTLSLTVSPAVLIPRPETEHIVELALNMLPQDKVCNVLELGTGSGAIALALGRERPQWIITATDISVQALEVARLNARQNNINNVNYIESNWFSKIPSTDQYDLIVSNPPYVAENDPHLQQGDLRFEPVIALSSGSQGLYALRDIISHSPAHLTDTGCLMVEHGYNQSEQVAQLFMTAGFNHIQCHTDYAQRERISLGLWKP